MTPRKALSPMKRLKIFEAADGVCHLCERKIRAGEKWDVSHDRPLGLLGEDGGKNLKVAHEKCHDIQTREIDIPAIAKAKRVKAKMLGIKGRSRFACGRDSKYRKKLSGEVVLR